MDRDVWAKRGAKRKSRQVGPPVSTPSPTIPLTPGGSMTANHAQALLSQPLAASTSSRRRSVPPSLPEPVSQSLNQRWRERPRCPAPRVTPGRRDGVVHAIVGRAGCRCPRAHVVQDKRIARVHVFASRFAGTMVPTKRTEIGSCASHGFLEETSRSWIQILRSHHRAFHSGAVLGVVNALRFASTRPSAGPAGIDDASARHVPGSYAMVLSVSIPQAVLTRETRRRMLTSSRQCRTGTDLRSPQRPTERASGRRPQGTASSAVFSTSQIVARQP